MGVSIQPGKRGCFGLVCLMAGALSGCVSSYQAGKETEAPIPVDVSKITFARTRQSVPVRVRVTNPDMSCRFVYHIVGSPLVTFGDNIYVMKFGQSLQATAPLVWAKYLDVRLEGEERLPTIEMEVADANGSQLQDLSSISALNTTSWVSWSFALTLRCRFLDAKGELVDSFNSTRSAGRNHVDLNANPDVVQECFKSPERFMVEELNEIIEEFFSSPKVLAALMAAGEQPPTRATTPPLPPIAKCFAVVVGIGKYQNAGKNGLTNLVYADDDAKAFAALLKKQGWSEDHVKLLVNEEATKGKVDIALESWLTKAGPDDLIVLFWSGHGFPDPEDPEKVYFACYDTDMTVPATGLRMDRVRTMLEERKARNVVVLADTCHAGKLITRDGDKAVGVRPYVEKMEKDKTLPKGWIFMVAADTDRTAIEHSSWSNGAFTHCLLEGLAGKADGYQGVGPKDGVVTMLELRTYLSSVMPEETQKVLGVAKRPIIATSSGDRQIWNLDLKGR